MVTKSKFKIKKIINKTNKLLIKTLALKEQGVFIEFQKKDLEILILRVVFSKIGTIIRGKSIFLHIRSM